MKMRFVTLCAFCLGVVVALIIPAVAQDDPFYVVRNPRGVNITAGTNFPSLAHSGYTPGDGSLHVLLIDEAASAPTLWVYSTSTTAWQPLLQSPMTDTLFADLGAPALGTVTYCSDCTVANPCAAAGNGAVAKYLNSVWVCN